MACSCNNTEKKEMLMQIRELKFSVNDLALYLDTHPNDRNALNLHNQYSQDLRNLTNQYQKKFGPLTIECPCNKWRWIDLPWPWERS